MAELESEHRRSIENGAFQADRSVQEAQVEMQKSQIHHEIRDLLISKLSGVFVVTLAICASVYNELKGGNTWLSVTLAGIPTAAVISIFFHKDKH